MNRLTNKICAITGAAGGIGSAIAKRLSEEGATLVLLDIDEDALVEVAKGLPGRSLHYVADVTDEQSMTAAVTDAVDKLGPIDVFFNNAGIPDATALADVDRERFDRVMAINVFGVLIGSKVAAAAMRLAGNGGKIVNTCSVAGKRAAPRGSIYSSSKFAVRAITQSLAQELAPDHITVNAFCPGIVDTPLWDKISDDMITAGIVSDAADILPVMGAHAILGRASQPDDLAGIAAFLASSDSDFMTGQCVNVDGGMSFD